MAANVAREAATECCLRSDKRRIYIIGPDTCNTLQYHW